MIRKTLARCVELISDDYSDVLRLGTGCSVGDSFTYDGLVVVGHNVSIGRQVTIREGTVIGNNVDIMDAVFIGPNTHLFGVTDLDTRAITKTVLDVHVCVEFNCVIYQGCTIGKHTGIDPYVTIGANTTIGANCSIGMGIKIGSDVVIADDTILKNIDNVPSGRYVNGNGVIHGRIMSKLIKYLLGIRG